MKIVRRFLMFFSPVLLLGLAFIFFPDIRPDISEYRELRRAEFRNPIEKSRDAKGTRFVKGTIVQQYLQGKFVTLDIGKLRLAIRHDTSAGTSPLMNLLNAHGGFYSGQNIELSVDPPRDVQEPPPLPKAKTPPGSGIVVSPAPGFFPPTAAPALHPIPTGTRVDLGASMLRFENGKFTIDGETVSTIEKPILMVISESMKVELVEDLKEELMPADRVLP